MDTAAPDPLDKLWTPTQRAAVRERRRQDAIKEANATIATIVASSEHTVALQLDVYRDCIVAACLEAHDEFVGRARQIMTAPEVEGREDLARHLILHTKHSPQAAIQILRAAGTDVAALPVGGARKERLAAMRRAAVLETSL